MPVLIPAATPVWQYTVQDVHVLARTHMNDIQASVFTDTRLLPHSNAAYRDLQADLAVNGVKTNTATVILLNILAGVTSLSDISTVLLPGDLLNPWKLEERGNGSGEKFQELLMATDGLDDVDQTQSLGKWEWNGNQINFIGSTRAMDLRLKYEKQLAALAGAVGADNMFNNANALSACLIRGGQNALAFKTCAYAARSRGVSGLAGDMEKGYEEQLSTLLSRYWKPKQRTPVRRRPYSARLRNIMR